MLQQPLTTPLTLHSRALVLSHIVYYAPHSRRREALSNTAILLSVPWHSCLGYRHVGCLQLSHRRPTEIYEPVRGYTVIVATVELPSGILSRCSWGDTLFLLLHTLAKY